MHDGTDSVKYVLIRSNVMQSGSGTDFGTGLYAPIF